MLIQKSKGSSAFDEQKVKNIDYNRFFPTLTPGVSLEKQLPFVVGSNFVV